MLPEALFYPASVAVVGASRNPGKVGHGVFANLVRGGFPGAVYGVNTGGGEVLGRPLCRAIEDIPGRVDLGIFVVPPSDVIDGIPRLAALGMKAAIVISAGFKETGGEGARLEARLRETAAAAGVRVLGPNCLGLIDSRARLNASFAAGTPPPGAISFFSQSGALCTAVLDWALGEGVGFRTFISLGNKADISESEILEHLARDPDTRVILGYVESIDDGRAFLAAARAATAKKPVIIVKAGATSAGARAASSHTGSLAGSDRAYAAAFRQAGILRVETFEDLLDLAKGFAIQAMPAGDRLLIVTNAGGPGILAADTAEKLGIPLADVGPGLRARLSARLPPAAGLNNPVDILGDARAERYRETLEAVREDPAIGSVLVLLTPQSMSEPAETARAVVGALSGSGKAAFASFLGDVSVREARRILSAGGIPEYPVPERAVRTLGAMRASRRLARPAHAPPGDLPGVDRTAAGEAFRDALSLGRRTLGEEEGRAVLEAYGFLFPRHALARTSVEAAAAFDRLGVPRAAVKIVSPDIVHKTDVGGVRLGVASGAEAAAAFVEITSAVRRTAPDAWIGGVSVQEMVTGGSELILGMTRDIQFGPLLMFGLGGIHVEVLKDVVFRVAPLSREEAHAMVREIRAFPLLAGFRGSEPADLEAIVDGLLRIAQLSLDFPQIHELDINPVMALPRGGGLRAIDCRLVIGEDRR